MGRNPNFQTKGPMEARKGKMRQILKIIAINLIYGVSVLASPSTIQWDGLPFSDKIKKSLLNEPYVSSEVTNPSESTQKIDFLIAGLHKKRCAFALVKLSQYERFQEFIGFIKKSGYDDKEGRIILSLSHMLLPFDMGLNFKLERISKPGLYRFLFDSGFLKGLKGEIHISQHKNNCLFVSTAKWHGKDTGIPNSVFSFFSSTLGERAMERLFRISETM